MLSTKIICDQLSEKQEHLQNFLDEQIKRTLKQPDAVLAECAELVTKLKSGNTPIRILLNTYNTPDGIGDAINLIGIYVRLKRLFANFPNIEMRAVVYINQEKLANFKRALPADNISDDDICYYTNQLTDSTKAITILSSPLTPELFAVYDVISTKLPSLKKFTQSCDLFLNIATQMALPTHPFSLLPKDCIIHSILETGHMMNLILNTSSEVRELRQFREVSMGIGKNDVGFRFDPKLVELVSDPVKANEAISRMKSSTLGKLIYRGNAKPRVAIGYLQSLAAVHLATGVFIGAGNKNRNVVIIGNSGYIAQYFKMYPNAKNEFTKIEYADCTGAITHVEEVNRGASRSMLAVEFQGIDDHSKYALICAADMVFGSGDNSRADTMLSRLPFWQILQWKITDVTEFIHAIEKSHPTVSNYLMLQLKSCAWGYELMEEAMFKDLINYLNENEDTLVKEWGELKKVVLEKHHLDHYLSSILLSALVKRLDTPNTLKQLGRFTAAVDMKSELSASKPFCQSEFTTNFLQSINIRIMKHYNIFMNMIAQDADHGLSQLFSIFPYFDVGSKFYACLNNDKPLIVSVIEAKASKCKALILKRQPELQAYDKPAESASHKSSMHKRK